MHPGIVFFTKDVCDGCHYEHNQWSLYGRLTRIWNSTKSCHTLYFPSRLFQATVRLVIDYKKTQKTILRVSPRVPLRELLPAICEKCEFDPQTTLLLRNVHSEDTLDLSGSLNDFGLREVYARDTKGQNPLCVYAKYIKMTRMKSCRTGFNEVTLIFLAVISPVSPISPVSLPPSPTHSGKWC